MFLLGNCNNILFLGTTTATIFRIDSEFSFGSKLLAHTGSSLVGIRSAKGPLVFCFYKHGVSEPAESTDIDMFVSNVGSLPRLTLRGWGRRKEKEKKRKKNRKRKRS
jgi:hypothetical protein